MKNWKKWIKSLDIEPNTDFFREPDPDGSVCSRCPALSTCPLYHDDLSNEERTVEQVCNEHFVKWSMGELSKGARKTQRCSTEESLPKRS